jgi:DNA polymerase-3 subunit epsilon
MTISILSNLPAFFLDIQATGSNPTAHVPLEVGWQLQAGLDTVFALRSHLIRIPEGVSVPPRIARLTGISADQLKRGCGGEKVGGKLRQYLERHLDPSLVAKHSEIPLIIHFARFETAFFELLNISQTLVMFPKLSVVCTYQIAKRLFDRSSRLGLRALSGYFGSSVDEKLRAGEHVRATRVIWLGLCERLATEEKVHNLSDLREWMKNDKDPKVLRASCAGSVLAPAMDSSPPDRPGIYMMLGKDGVVLYVGKAKSLKQRVRSYFHPSSKKTHPQHIKDLLAQAHHIKFIESPTALEAALQEVDYIYQHQPAWNRALKKGNRELAYFNTELDRYSVFPGKQFSLGPWTCVQFVLTVSLLARCQIEQAFQEFSVFLFNSSCTRELFQEGVRLLGEEISFDPNPEYPLSSINYWGRRLWVTKIQERLKNGSGESEELEETKDGYTHEWTGKRVRDFLKSMINTVAWEYRRSLWFLMLSESGVSWKLPSHPSFRSLLFHRGAITAAKTSARRLYLLNRGNGSANKNGFYRLRQMNLQTFDRMRVLTTELRTLVFREKAKPVIWISQAQKISGRNLKEILYWI